MREADGRAPACSYGNEQLPTVTNTRLQHDYYHIITTRAVHDSDEGGNNNTYFCVIVAESCWLKSLPSSISVSNWGRNIWNIYV